MTDVSLINERSSRSRRTSAAAARQPTPRTTQRTQRTQREISIPDLGAGEARGRLAQALSTFNQPLQAAQAEATNQAIERIDERIVEAQREAFNQALSDPRAARLAAERGEINVPPQFQDLPAFAHTFRVTSAKLGAQEDARDFREALTTANPADPEAFLTEFSQSRLEGSNSPVFSETYQGALRDAVAGDITTFRKTRQAVAAQQSLTQVRSTLQGDFENGALNGSLETLHQWEGRYISSAIGPDGKAAARQQLYNDLARMAVSNPDVGYLQDLLNQPDPEKDGQSIADIMGPEAMATVNAQAIAQLTRVKNVEHAQAVTGLEEELALTKAGRGNLSLEELLKQSYDIDQRWGTSGANQSARAQILTAIQSNFAVGAAVDHVLATGSAEGIKQSDWNKHSMRILEAVEGTNPGAAAVLLAERGPGSEGKGLMERDLMSSDQNRSDLALRRMRGMEGHVPGAVHRWFSDDVAAMFHMRDNLEQVGVPFETLQEAIRKSGGISNLSNFRQRTGISTDDWDKVRKRVLKGADIKPGRVDGFADLRLDRLLNSYLGVADALGQNQEQAEEALGRQLRNVLVPTLEGGDRAYTSMNFNPIGRNAQGTAVRVRPRTHDELRDAQREFNSRPDMEAFRDTFGEISGFTILEGAQHLGYLAKSDLGGLEQELVFPIGGVIPVPTGDFPSGATEQIGLLSIPGVTVVEEAGQTLVRLPAEVPPRGIEIPGTNLRLQQMGNSTMGIFLGGQSQSGIDGEAPTSPEEVLEEFTTFTTETQEKNAEIEALTGAEGELRRMREEGQRYIDGLNMGFGTELPPGEASQGETPDDENFDTNDTPGFMSRVRTWLDDQMDDHVATRKVPPQVVAAQRSRGVGSPEEAFGRLEELRLAAREEGSDTDDPAQPDASFDQFATEFVSNEEGVRRQRYADPPGTRGVAIGRGIQLVNPETGKIPETAKRWFAEAGLPAPSKFLNGTRVLTGAEEQRLFQAAFADRKVVTQDRFSQVAKAAGFEQATINRRWGELSDHQRVVLMSLVWNGGPGLVGPEIVKAIMDRDDTEVVNQIRTNSGSQRNRRLQRRRDKEARAWLHYKTLRSTDDR